MRKRLFGRTIAAGAATLALCAAGAAGAQAERIEWTSPVTFQTPAGAVSCPASGEAPLWAEATFSATPMKLTGEIVGVSPLRCTTASYGEVELKATGLPWHLIASVKKRTGRLKGSKKLGLEVTLLSLGVKCIYEAAKATGSLSTETPPSLHWSLAGVKLNTALSFPLCPAGGSFEGTLPLP